MANLPSVRQFIQTEETVSRFAVAESVLQKVGSVINWIVDNVQSAGVGDVEMSFLTEAQFQAIRGTGWVLCDGRSVEGSQYEAVTGASAIPDMRGRYPRMKDHGAGRETRGELATGTSYDDEFKSHQHGILAASFGGGPLQNRLLRGNGAAFENNSIYDTVASGGAETNPKTTVLNFFVRIN
jgi:microcystin-dependent protein